MTDFDTNLDTLLTTDEEMPVVDEAPANADEPNADDVVTDEPTEDQPQSDETATESEDEGPEAGSQQPSDEENKPRTDDTVPLKTYMDLKHGSREQMRELRQQNQQLLERLERVEQNQQAGPPQEEDGIDDDEPLTRADLRRIEHERIEKANQQTQQQTAAKVRNALLLAEPAEERLLMVAEQYLSAADRQAIAQSDNVLETATTLAKARVNAYGTEDQVAWLERLFPAQEATSRQPSPKQQRKADRQSKRQAQAPDEEAADASTGPDLNGGARSVVDHMFA